MQNRTLTHAQAHVQRAADLCQFGIAPKKETRNWGEELKSHLQSIKILKEKKMWSRYLERAMKVQSAAMTCLREYIGTITHENVGYEMAEHVLDIVFQAGLTRIDRVHQGGSAIQAALPNGSSPVLLNGTDVVSSADVLLGLWSSRPDDLWVLHVTCKSGQYTMTAQRK